MCGIFALLSSTQPDSIVLKSAMSLANRGPDSCTTITTKTGFFVFHRLAINDVSFDGNQPMVSGNVLMMCNGEIYNHKELEQEFNLTCHSKSDCEVILRLYEKIGFVETVKRLRGVYAIILVDEKENKVFVARDRIGVRPLYFGLTGNNELAIASVPQALIPFCKGISPIRPGFVCLHDLNRKKTENRIPIFEFLWNNLPVISMDKFQDSGILMLRDNLIYSVKVRLISDRPIGCLLSGGLDSSIVASILVRFLGSENVRTYSIGMEGSTDLFYARKVADFLGTKHTEVLFTEEEGLKVIPDVVKTLCSYDITTIRASVGMYLLAKYISENTTDKVIFSGEGSDELLEGYLYFHNAPNPEEGERETLRLIRELHQYDVLRVDRCISSFGLEPRVPFLDRDVVDCVMRMGAKEKFYENKDGKKIEKYILRRAFEDFLPSEIVWRRKEAFSDGVSKKEKSWYKIIQDFCESKVSNEIFNDKLYPSKEAQYYRLLFDRFFNGYDPKIPYWLPRWCGNTKDPSARVLGVYN